MIVNKEQIDSLNKLLEESREDTADINVDDVLAIDVTLLVNIGVSKFKIEPSGKTLEQGWEEVEF